MQRSRNWLTLTGFKNSNLTSPSNVWGAVLCCCSIRTWRLCTLGWCCTKAAPLSDFTPGAKDPVAQWNELGRTDRQCATAPSPQAQRRL